VLGAGGAVGKAWQSGLMAGLIGQQIDVADASLILGTSTGAIVGAQVALGLKFIAPAKLDFAVQELSVSSYRGVSELLPATARAIRSSEPEIERAKIGAFALAAQTIDERDSLARPIFAGIRGPWPKQFRAVAVNAHTGKLQVWDAASGATLQRAVASSAAAPGIWPPITINGGQYIDGSIRSMLNADLAVGCEVVIVVSCFALEAVNGPDDPDWAATIAAQIDELRSLRKDSAVIQITPPESFLELTHRGAAMMDGTLAADAFRIGRAQAVQAAETFRSALSL
jgi:NTE family protein